MCTVCGCSVVSNTEATNKKYDYEYPNNIVNSVHDYSQGQARSTYSRNKTR